MTATPPSIPEHPVLLTPTDFSEPSLAGVRAAGAWAKALSESAL